MTESNYFLELYNIDVSEKKKEKNGLNYLSWAAAWAEVKKIHPDATFTIYEEITKVIDGTVCATRPWFVDPVANTAWVKTGVTVNGIEYIEELPIMDFRNKSIPADKITSTDANKSVQRSLTKACARHGLGLYIYEGEDIPEEEKAKIKKAEEEKSELEKANAECFAMAKEKSKIDNGLVAKMCKKYVDNGNPKHIKNIEDSRALLEELKTIKEKGENE